MFKPLLTLLAGVVVSLSALAQVDLNPDHPESYEVQRGDTLWGIAERFLQDPWLWPEIWHVNPQIENPHLIYPGDIIDLTYVDGRPRLGLRRGERPTVKLSPHARRTPLSDAIDPIDLEQIRPFLVKRTIIDEATMDDMAYVFHIEEGHIAGGQGQNIYVRDLDAEVGQSFAIVRPTVKFVEVPATWPYDEAEEFEPGTEDWSYPGGKSISDHVDDFWDHYAMRRRTNATRVLGYEVRQTGIAEVVATGDPTTMVLTSVEIEVLPGDIVMPLFTTNYDQEYIPHGFDQVPENTRVIALSNALFGAARNQVIAINKGTRDGVEHGHVMSVFTENREVRDTVKYPRDDVKTYFSRERRRDARVEIPKEYAGHVMIFRAYDHVSYGLIVRSKQAFKVGYHLQAP
ncbi:MAG: LysM peptidoglycan-binding domain-containing protein [Xanthomonadales bacterium]|nr:LysM peptidoglycan-binding domain-containing protein [Xanthomonadales bacterium]